MAISKKILYGLFMFLGILFVCMLPAKNVHAAAPGGNGTYDYGKAQEVLKYVNEERSRLGLNTLTMDQELTDAAMLRAVECTVSFSHTRPDGTSCFTVSSKAAGENIAYGYPTASDVFTAWKNSPGHYRNMTESSFQSVGIGCYYNGRTWYWTQVFSRSRADVIDTRGTSETEQTPTEPAEKPEQPAETPTKPADTPAEPTETPAKPVETPTEPTETPAKPVETPAEPTETPAKPVETPTEPTETPAKSAETPAKPAETPTKPVETPTQPADNSSDSQCVPEKQSCKSYVCVIPSSNGNCIYYDGNGVWYMQNGKVNYGFCGKVKCGNKTCTVVNGKICVGQ